MPLVYQELSYQIRGALYEVYNALGPDFGEETYTLAVIMEELHPRHAAQLLSYLRASGLRVGLLVNFGGEQLKIVRRVN